MSDGSKRYKGQIQVYEGSPTGEPIVTTLFEPDSTGNVKFIGEAKIGSPQNAFKWFLTKFEYDSTGNIAAIKTAINQITTNATNVTVDIISNPGFTRIQLIGGDLSLVNIGDKVFLTTGSNSFEGSYITQILSSTEVLIADIGINETGTAISPADCTISLEGDDNKGYDKRQWAKRALYIYN